MNNVEKAVLYYLGKDGINTTSLAVEHLSSLFPHAFKDYKSAFSHAFLNLYNKHYLVREKTKKNGPYVYALSEGGKQKLIDMVFYRSKDTYFRDSEVWPKLPIDKDYSTKPLDTKTIEKMIDKNELKRRNELLDLIKQRNAIEKKIIEKYSDLSKSVYGFDVFHYEKEQDNVGFETEVDILNNPGKWKPVTNKLF